MSKGMYKRNYLTLGRKMRSLMLLTFSSEACAILSITADSIIGQRYIDDRTVAAIALLSTFFTTFSALHDLLASCMVTLVVRKKCKYGNEEASRTMTEVLCVAFVAYVVLMVVISLAARPFLGLMTDDRELIDLAMWYYAPILYTCPIMEVFLCLERGYKTEGNTGFFAMRPVITNVVNIILDLYFVVFLNKDIRWLAYATVLSQAAGYAWSVSYRFRAECRMHLDFSGLRKKGRIIASIKEQVEVGTSYFYGDLLQMAGSALNNKAMLICGGTAALVCYGVLNNIRNIIIRICTAVISNSNILSTALFVEKDNRGLRMVFHITASLLATITLIPIAAVNLFPEVFAKIYSVTDSVDPKLLRTCFAFLSFYIFWNIIAQFLRTFLISIHREKYSVVLSVGERAATIISVLLTSLTGDIAAVWAAMGWGSGIFIVIFVIVFVRKNIHLQFKDHDVLSFSTELNGKTAADMSGEVSDCLKDTEISTTVINNIALVVEECSMIILQENEGKTVNADIRVLLNDDDVSVFFYYDGRVFEAEKAIRERTAGAEDDLGMLVLSRIVDGLKYTRVVEMNCLEFSVGRKTA